LVEVMASEGLQDVATGGGAAWFIASGELTRVDERTGVVRGLRVGRLQPIGANHEFAVGEGSLWTVSLQGLQRRSLATGRVERSLALKHADAVAVAKGAVWVATSDDRLYRLDPRTLRVTLRISLA
jgi:streptogramin lyase